MKAILKSGSRVSLERVRAPAIRAADDVLVRVAIAGICRTDLHVAEGRIPSRDPVVLGHELAGVVDAIGASVRSVAPGDRVTALPVVSCGVCVDCRAGARAACAEREMLGIERDGAFAELVVLPEAALRRLPDGVSLLAGAYAEPVAAALAVLRAGLPRGGRGLILGRSRIAALVERVLRADGFADVVARDLDGPPLPRSAFDFAVETTPTAEALRALADAVRPGGTIVLKSRCPEPVPVDFTRAVFKDLTLRAVSWAPLEDALAALASGRLRLEDLVGEVHPLEDAARAFALARADESVKRFLAPDPGALR